MSPPCMGSGLCVLRYHYKHVLEIWDTYIAVAQRSKQLARSRPGSYKLQSCSTRAQIRLHRFTYRFSSCDAYPR